MKRIVSTVLYLLLLLLLVGCSIDISQPTTISTPTYAGGPTPLSNGAGVPTLSSSDSSRAVAWAQLHLTGRLVYTRLSSNNDIPELNIETLDLTTGEIHKVFTAPEDAWIYYSAVSPDGQQVIISYVPPSSSSPSRNQVLYRVPIDGSAPPELVVTPASESDQYIQVEWSPDGKYLYYVYNNYSTQPADQIFPNYRIFRMAYPNGEPEQILEHAFWPRVSPDSSKLVYVSVDPVTGKNDLFVANADGTNAQEIDLGSLQASSIKDAPFFTSDGQSVLFNAPGPTQSYQPNWLDRLMGVQIAKAHGLPSDWWSVPVSGGEPRRLTQIQSMYLFGRMSPDKQHVVSYSMQGLFVMDLDGSNLTSIIPDPSGNTVDWLP